MNLFQILWVRWWVAHPIKKTCSTDAEGNEIHQGTLRVLKENFLYFPLNMALVNLLISTIFT